MSAASREKVRGSTNAGLAGQAQTPVMVLVKRDGSARAFPLEEVTSKTLKNEIAVNVAKEAIILTDELSSYQGVRDDPALHRTVKHSAGEYARRDADGLNVHTNTAESFFALLKRGHYGVFHPLSKHHLYRYCNEFGFRLAHRKTSDGERMTATIRGAKGRRLLYRAPVSGLVSGA